MKQSITQEHVFGCGIACATFLIGGAYQKIAPNVDKLKIESPHFYCRDLVQILNKYSFNYSYQRIRQGIKRKRYKEGVIVFIQKSKKYIAGHYLVRHKNQWMDSWINLTANRDVNKAKSGFRKRLPGKPTYIIYPLT